TTLCVAILTLASASAWAQRSRDLTGPDPSPAASVSQTIGLTEMKVSYHRPAVNDRKIWGTLVPYGEVWRAGANEDTTISFSTPVKFAGKPLKAGTYGLHMIPSSKDFTVIVSNMAGAWGSYGYNQKEDVFRVNVTPRPADMLERLQYTFDDPTDNS